MTKTTTRIDMCAAVLPWTAALFFASGVMSCASPGVDTDTLQVSGTISSELLPESPVWYTDPPDEAAIQYRWSPDENLSVGFWQESGPTQIRINPDVSHQEILGIGTSLEATSVYAFQKGGDSDGTVEIIHELLSPDKGLGFDLFRICIGTSDFSDGRAVSDHPLGFYTYRERPDDPFSIEKDEKTGLLPFLRQFVSEADSLGLSPTLFASTWSPPAWMKTSERLIGGTLKEGYEGEMASYLRSFVEAYENEGIAVHALTIQNEPNFVPRTYPGMMLSWQQERDIVKEIYENFRNDAEGRDVLETRLWVNDHNFEHWPNADSLLSSLEDEGKGHYVDAVAFHNYSSYPPTAMTELTDRHPAVDVVFTEHSEWGTAGMYNIQQYFLNGSRTYAYWVTATTEDLGEHNQGPYNRLGELSPTLMIRRQPGEWTRTPEYYMLGQFSRYIDKGARRIDCAVGDPSWVTAVAFQNPGGELVVVLVNQTEVEQPFSIVLDQRQITGDLPAKSIGTYVIEAE